MTERNFDVLKTERGLIKHWTRGVEFEEEAQKQLKAITYLPFIYPHIAVMADVHAGIGSTVGSVIPTLGAVIPSFVGVDIGCGMMALKLPLKASDLPDSLSEIRSKIEAAVPHGRTNNGKPGDRGAWGEPPKKTVQTWQTVLLQEYADIIYKHPKAEGRAALNHLGTLGTGNHFIEICCDITTCTDCLGWGKLYLDDIKLGPCKKCTPGDYDVWVVLHSGSRGVGNRFGSYFIELAKKDMETWFINLPNKDLAYFPEGTEHFKDYVQAVTWAQTYAMVNRELMMVQVLDALSTFFPQIKPNNTVADLDMSYGKFVSCHHNYVTREHHGGKNVFVTRKGAVCAREGVMGIIPGSMGAKTYIVKGKGNPDSLDSCSHGAGRKMSRTQARNTFSLEDHAKATAGVECRKDADVLDETPGAYKDIDAVMEAQKDLVEVVYTLKQVLCVKG